MNFVISRIFTGTTFTGLPCVDMTNAFRFSAQYCKLQLEVIYIQVVFNSIYGHFVSVRYHLQYHPL